MSTTAEIRTLEDFTNKEAEEPGDEILDLIAEAARISPYAKRAYNLLRADWPDISTLEARQSLIAGRMGEVAA